MKNNQRFEYSSILLYLVMMMLTIMMLIMIIMKYNVINYTISFLSVVDFSIITRKQIFYFEGRLFVASLGEYLLMY